MKKMMLLILMSVFGISITYSQTTIICDSASVGFYYINFDDCTKFAICGGEKPNYVLHEYTCPPGCEFNEKKSTCDVIGSFEHECGCNE